ncbi:hypothetical protein C8T65DRAFT_744717 [Cerioporus squamosus]|nr:hypothetical protein C8T65DRAFT_744717 [Cerioporus squamosus]
MFPSTRLPDELNPFCVDCNDHQVENLPLIWFGVPFDEDRLFAYAARCGWAVKEHPDDDEYCTLRTWRNLVLKFFDKYGMRIQARDVWGLSGGKLLLTCFANRDIGTRFTGKHCRVALKWFEAMGFAKDEPKWYLDVMEEVRLLFQMFRALSFAAPD